MEEDEDDSEDGDEGYDEDRDGSEDEDDDEGSESEEELLDGKAVIPEEEVAMARPEDDSDSGRKCI